MNRIKSMVLVAFAMCCAAASAWAGGNVDDDLRTAAKLHQNGETARAMAIWRSWAERGDVDSAYNLAIVHHYGEGVPRSTDEALKWYRLAAERGDRPSQSQLGLMYLNGDGVPADPEEARRWFGADRQHRMHRAANPQMRQALAASTTSQAK